MHDPRSGDAQQKGRIGTSDRTAAIAFGGRYSTTKHIVFIVNNDRFFLTHRASWASAFRASGALVTVIAQDTGHSDDIRELGFNYVPLHFGRESITAKQALKTSLRILLLLLKLKPDVVFLVATAAYVLGWPAAVLFPKTLFVRVITGAGRALEKAERKSTTSMIVRGSLRISGRLKNVHSLFQIRSNLESFVSGKLCSLDRSLVIPGTGIDTDSWIPPGRATEHPIVVLFAARLFREKGIYEFVELARNLAREGVRFVIVGEPDYGVSSSVAVDELAQWQNEGVIEYWGRRDDMKPVFKASDIIVLPSRHPEGTPRVLIEAAACGVVAIASDQPGCREVVVEGETGLIADMDQEGSLAASLQQLLSDHEYRKKLSTNARLRATEIFSLAATLEPLYETLKLERCNERASELTL